MLLCVALELNFEQREMTKRAQYKSPPIREALCELAFVPDRPWNATIPGKVHIRIQDAYGGEPQQQSVMETHVDTQPGQRPNVSYREGLRRIQLPTADGTRLVAIGENVLSVHMLQPYQAGDDLSKTGWVEFRSRISEALDAYWEVAQPNGVNRIGLRYVNAVEIQGQDIVVTDYIRSGPQNISGLPNKMINFASRDEYLYDDGVRLIISQGVAPPSKPDSASMLLDIDLIWSSDKSLDREDALATADDLRGRERTIFELLITDKAREVFSA